MEPFTIFPPKRDYAFTIDINIICRKKLQRKTFNNKFGLDNNKVKQLFSVLKSDAPADSYVDTGGLTTIGTHRLLNFPYLPFPTRQRVLVLQLCIGREREREMSWLNNE